MDSKIKCQEISVIRWLMGRLDVAEDRVLDLEAACELSLARLHSKKRDHDHLTEMHAIAIVALSDQLLKTEAYKKCMNLYKNASVAWCASVDDPVFESSAYAMIKEAREYEGNYIMDEGDNE